MGGGEMNEILKKRIEDFAAEYADSMYKNSTDGERRAAKHDVIRGAEFILYRQWISVEWALPERSVMVFVKDKYGNYDTAYLSKKGYWIANDGKEIIVSFWMPIPKFKLNKPE